MKKWQKRLVALIVAAVALVAAIVCAYEFYAKEKIEETLKKAQEVLLDEDLRRDVNTLVDEMIQNGELDSSQIEGYVMYEEAMNNPSATPKPKTLIERVREAMTAEEFSFAMSMYSKLDVGYIISNISSNKEAVKEYIKSVLTSSELSKSLEIYGKYSYLLK